MEKMTVKNTAVIVLNLKLCMLFESLHKSVLQLEHLQSEPPPALQDLMYASHSFDVPSIQSL